MNLIQTFSIESKNHKQPRKKNKNNNAFCRMNKKRNDIDNKELKLRYTMAVAPYFSQLK